MSISEVIHQTLAANNALDLVPLVKWEWNTRLTSTMGRYHPGTKKIDFSVVLFGRATQAEQDNTVAHEVCHMIVRHQFPHASAHGWEWKRAMRNAGYEPTRCHSVKVDRRARKPTKRYRLLCGCADGCIVTQNLITRMRKRGEFDANGVNHFRRCRTCRQSLRAK